MKFGCNLIGGLWRDSQQMEPTRNPSDLTDIRGQFAWATIDDAADALAAMVMINAATAGVDCHVPFGGKPPSGYGGHGNGAAAIEFYTQSKTTYHAYSSG